MIRRIRVLHVIQNLNYGGMERLFGDIVRLLDPNRFESHVLVLEYFGRFAEGLEHHATLHKAAPMGRWSMLRPSALTSQIYKIAPDVVHTHSGVWYKVSLAAQLAGVPRLVHTEHGRLSPDPWLARKIGWLAPRRTDCVVAVSEVLQRQLIDTVVSRSTRVSVIHNGVDTGLYAPKPDSGKLRQQLGLKPEVPILGSIGRLELIKGYDVMIEAFALLRRDWTGGPAPVLVIGGDGSQKQGLQARIDTLGLAGTAYLLGWRDDIHDLQSAFTVFTMSSRSEGTSVSLLEAMSAGLCPVVTDVGGNAAVLGRDLARRLVPAENPAALAAAWKNALADAAARQRDAELARRRIIERFSLHAMVAGYAQLYQGVAEGSPRLESSIPTA